MARDDKTLSQKLRELNKMLKRDGEKIVKEVKQQEENAKAAAAAAAANKPEPKLTEAQKKAAEMAAKRAAAAEKRKSQGGSTEPTPTPGSNKRDSTESIVSSLRPTSGALMSRLPTRRKSKPNPAEPNTSRQSNRNSAGSTDPTAPPEASNPAAAGSDIVTSEGERGPKNDKSLRNSLRSTAARRRRLGEKNGSKSTTGRGRRSGKKKGPRSSTGQGRKMGEASSEVVMDTEDPLFESLGAEAVGSGSMMNALRAIGGMQPLVLALGGFVLGIFLAFWSPAAFLYFWPISFLLNVLSTANLL
mmetsp:Transcript_8585/g.15728  ORF Transcript_8585/g.15728 Transcript_8585/m.15728 type:complete len:302 (-) Transcript_8585:1642-2547(-)